MNSAWLAAALIAAALLSWLRLIALDGDLAKAEPKTLRYPDPARGRQARVPVAAAGGWKPGYLHLGLPAIATDLTRVVARRTP